MSNNRRDFLKKMGAVTGAGLFAAGPVASLAATSEKVEATGINDSDKPFTISILQTTDVH